MGRKGRTSTAATDLSDSALCRLAAGKAGVKAAKMISPTDVETAAWVRLKCQYGCDGYTTVRKAGFPIEVVRGTRQCPDYYGLVLVG